MRVYKIFILILLFQVLGAFLSIFSVEALPMAFQILKLSISHVLRFDFWSVILQTVLVVYLTKERAVPNA